jgi:hypothetical protein
MRVSSQFSKVPFGSSWIPSIFSENKFPIDSATKQSWERGSALKITAEADLEKQRKLVKEVKI